MDPSPSIPYLMSSRLVSRRFISPPFGLPFKKKGLRSMERAYVSIRAKTGMAEPSASLTLLPDFWLHTPVASFQNKRAQAKALQEMKSRVAELQARIAKDVDYAFEALLQVQPDLSLKMEIGLEEGSSYTAVTKAFRRKAKELHPDARAGDRSGEVQLRKLIAAYQYIKSIYNWGEDTPSPSRGA